jgi:Glycosyltransferase
MQRKIRILYFVDRLKFGGIQAFLQTVLQRLDFDRFQVDFILFDDGITYGLEQTFRDFGCGIYKVCRPAAGHVIRSFAELDRFFKKHRGYDIVHSHGSSKNGIILWFAQRYNIKIRISHSHNTKFQSKNIFIKACGTLMKIPNCRLATDYFACSELAWNWLFDHRYAKNLPRHIIKPCVEAQSLRFDPVTRDIVRRELHIGSEYVIANISRFVHQKNHNFILEVFKSFLSLHSSAKLLLGGEGELSEDIRYKAEAMGLSEHVIFTGFRRDTGRLLQAADLFLMPSINEGLPTVAVEAQAAGVPCVLSDTITRECKILDETSFLSLSSPANEWAGAVDSILLGYIRRDTSKLVSAEGFDARETVNWLCEYYVARVGQELSGSGVKE